MDDESDEPVINHTTGEIVPHVKVEIVRPYGREDETNTAQFHFPIYLKGGNNECYLGVTLTYHQACSLQEYINLWAKLETEEVVHTEYLRTYVFEIFPTPTNNQTPIKVFFKSIQDWNNFNTELAKHADELRNPSSKAERVDEEEEEEEESDDRTSSVTRKYVGESMKEATTSLMTKEHEPLIIRKYTQYGFPLYVAMICGANLDNLDEVVHGFIEKNRERLTGNTIQGMRNIVGELTECLTQAYHPKTEGVAVIWYVDKMMISSLFGDFMTHTSCRIELFSLLQMSCHV